MEKTGTNNMAQKRKLSGIDITTLKMNEGRLKYDELVKIAPTMIREPLVALIALHDLGYKLHNSSDEHLSDKSTCCVKQQLFSIGIVIINQLFDMCLHQKIDWVAKIYESGDDIADLMKTIIKWDTDRKIRHKRINCKDIYKWNTDICNHVDHLVSIN